MCALVLLWLISSGFAILLSLVPGDWGILPLIAVWAFSQLPLVAIILQIVFPSEVFLRSAVEKYTPKDAFMPIRIPREWPNIDCPRTMLRRRLPAVGWLFGFLYEGRYQVLDEVITEALKARLQSIQEAWSGHEHLTPIAVELQRILCEHCWRFPPVFLPEDEYAAIGQLETGDLCEIEALMAMEETFGIDIKISGEHPCLQGTMLDLARYLYNNRSEQKDAR